MKIIHSGVKARTRLEKIRKSRGYKYLWWDKTGKVHIELPPYYVIRYGHPDGDAIYKNPFLLYFITYIYITKGELVDEVREFVKFRLKEDGLKSKDKYDYAFQVKSNERVSNLKKGRKT